MSERENVWCGHSDRCPPHDFRAAWSSEDVGVLFCRLCGEVMALTPQSIEAPKEERIEEEAK